jgi:hypothetical protein
MLVEERRHGMNTTSIISLLVGVSLSFAGGTFAVVGSAYREQVTQAVSTLKAMESRISAIETQVVVNERVTNVVLKAMDEKIGDVLTALRSHVKVAP